MKKVYLVEDYGVCELESYMNPRRTFNTKEKALEEFQRCVKSNKELIRDYDERWEIEETENKFESWEEGDYSYNHFIVELIELEVE